MRERSRYHALSQNVKEPQIGLGDSRLDENPDEILKLESFFAELVSLFVRINPYKVEGLIGDALQQIGEFSQIDWSYLAQISKDGSRFHLSHFWLSDRIQKDEIVEYGKNLTEVFPWITQRMLRQEEVLLYRFDDLPVEAVAERDYWRKFGCKSILVLPVAADHRVIGMMGFECACSKHDWSAIAIRRMRIVAEILATALCLKRNREDLEDRLRFEEILSALSTTFVSALPDQVDEYISKGLQKVIQSLGVDFITLNQFDREGSLIRLTHRTAKTDIMIPGSIYNEKLPWLTERLVKKNLIQINRIDDWPPEATKEREVCQRNSIRSCLMVPYVVKPCTLGYLALNTTRTEKIWTREDIRRARLVGEVIGNALSRKESDLKLKEAFAEVKQLKDRLEHENIYLKEEIELGTKHEAIIGQSDAMRRVLSRAEQVAPTDSTVLILGETGTGKELLANALHRMSSRKDRPMIKVNCAALPPTLMESELFGREKGAYTGALSRQLGRFEIADGSTIFLDEIGELPMELQAKLLRVLQEHQFERLGSTKTISVNVRVIASTNRNLVTAVKEGRFREDLYYRLNVFPLVLPPLRERREDIPLLVFGFVEEFIRTMGKRIETIPRKNIEILQRYSWPGNIRELRNMVEQAMIVCKGDTLEIRIPEAISRTETNPDLSLVEAERQHIVKVLQSTGWRVKGKMGAAEILDLHPATLNSKMKKLRIKRLTNADDISSEG